MSEHGLTPHMPLSILIAAVQQKALDICGILVYCRLGLLCHLAAQTLRLFSTSLVVSSIASVWFSLCCCSPASPKDKLSWSRIAYGSCQAEMSVLCLQHVLVLYHFSCSSTICIADSDCRGWREGNAHAMEQACFAFRAEHICMQRLASLTFLCMEMRRYWAQHCL